MAKVFTVEEIQKELTELETVDGITCATFAVISTPAIIYEFRFTESGKYRKAISVNIEGEETTVGPAPNETLGLVDGIASRPKFLEKLLNNKTVTAVIKAETLDGKIETLKRELTTNDFDYIKLLFTRVCVKNYMAFITEKPTKTIFSVSELKNGELTFSGCGTLNPLEHFSIKPGEKIFIAGTTGIVIGEGTRSKPEKPNLSVVCDFKKVKKEYFGIYETSGGTEFYVGLGIRKDKIDTKTYKKIVEKTDKKIPLPIANVIGRNVIETKTYYDVWKFDEELKFDKSKCKNCLPCIIEEKCPSKAFLKNEGFLKHCMFCGACLNFCPFSAVEGNLGTVEVKNKLYKITLRQSSIKRAREIAEILKTYKFSDKM